MSENHSAKYEPHVMVDVVDPMKDGASSTWKACFYSMLFVEVLHVFTFVWFAWNSAKWLHADGELWTTINWKHVAGGIFTIISMVLIFSFWNTVARHQSTLDYNISYLRFRIRNFKGLESFSKYGEDPRVKTNILMRLIYTILNNIGFFANAQDVIMSFTGITHFDRKTGLTTEKVNEDTWVLSHPYKGDHGFNLFAVPKFVDTDEVIIANFLEAVNTLPADHLVSTTMISGHNTSYIMDDIEEQLKLPNLSPIREKALYSIYEKFKNRVGTEQPIFIIHIGLPPAVHEYEHIENMRKARDEFELTLNDVGIDTVLIKDPEDLTYIMNGMFTGNLVIGKDINEY